MDFSGISVFDIPIGSFGAGLPDYVWAGLASALATLGLMTAFGPRAAVPRTASEPSAATACDFLVHGGALQPLTEPARAMIDALAPGTGRLAALRKQLAADQPGIDADLEGLILYGVAFRRHCQRPDGSAFGIVGETRGAAAYLSIRPASEEARALRDAEIALRRVEEEARFLREVLDRAPVMAWSLGPDGAIGWANAAYRDRFAPPAGDLPDHRIPDAFGHVLDEVPLTARSGGRRRRVSVLGLHDGEAHWFELCQSDGPMGETLGFALDADDLVAAEASLRRFIETLTETFAHLPIGLAVFDKNRRLGLFNPALTDLVKIDAVWLAGRPSLRDFLERLRETRQMPEQKDFASWRRKLGELEEGARDGTYEENWVLPSGKVFRVTGRPHPQGALAFLFEDISSSILLERKYRSELELSQATLDRLAEGVAVFDTGGMLVFVNSAFEKIWGTDPMQRLEGPGVADLTELWGAKCRPTPVWARLREFATGGEARSSWSDTVETRDGRIVQVLVAALPDASALVVFRSLTEERALIEGLSALHEAPDAVRAQDLLIEDFAQAQIELPAEAAVAQMAAAIPAAGSPQAFQALTAAAQNLRDGLAQSRALRAIARRAGDLRGPAPGLAELLGQRGLALVLTGEDAVTSVGVRRALWALALAAADMSVPGAEIAVAIETGDAAGLEICASLPDQGGAVRAEGVSLALARGIVASLGGTLALDAAAGGGRISLRAILPAGAEAGQTPPVALSA